MKKIPRKQERIDNILNKTYGEAIKDITGMIEEAVARPCRKDDCETILRKRKILEYLIKESDCDTPVTIRTLAHTLEDGQQPSYSASIRSKYGSAIGSLYAALPVFMRRRWAKEKAAYYVDGRLINGFNEKHHAEREFKKEYGGDLRKLLLDTLYRLDSGH